MTQSISSPVETAPITPSRVQRAWIAPRPSPALMWVLGIVNRWLLLLGLPVLRRIPGLRDLPVVHGYFWIRRIDLPAADRARLVSAVNSRTAAFIGPNHPEFGTDWLIDKELSTIVSPVMASWADRGIVAAAPRFWGMNNLIANDGGDAAKEYSVQQAVAGNGVLLHPEGTVRWTNDVVHPLFPGIAQMAMKAATMPGEKPVFVVPVVWKYHFITDVSARTHREMGIIERALGLPVMRDLSVSLRFYALQSNLLASRMRDFGYNDPGSEQGFFERQAAFQRHLMELLEQRHVSEHALDMDKRIARMARTIRSSLSDSRSDASSSAEYRAVLKHDLAIVEEAKRLGEFTREAYGMATLTQEQVFESLKRTRDRLMRRGWRNALANMLPRPFGPRVVYVGVPEPLAVTRDDATSGKAYENRLLEHARTRMQETLDGINARIAEDVQRHAHLNPFLGEEVAVAGAV